jgi:hypothetical protein
MNLPIKALAVVLILKTSLSQAAPLACELLVGGFDELLHSKAGAPEDEVTRIANLYESVLRVGMEHAPDTFGAPLFRALLENGENDPKQLFELPPSIPSKKGLIAQIAQALRYLGSNVAERELLEVASVELKALLTQLLKLEEDAGSKRRTSRDRVAKERRQHIFLHSVPVFSVSFSEDLKKLRTVSMGWQMRTWDLNGSLLETILPTGHQGNLNPTSSEETVALAPDGSWLVTSAWRAPHVWESNGRLLFAISGFGSAAALAISPDGKYFAAGADPSHHGLAIWDRKGQTVRVFEGHKGLDRPYDVRFSRDGSQIVSGSGDQFARVWDVATGKLLRALEHPKEGVRAVAISPDGSRIATSMFPRLEVMIWDSNPQPLAVLTLTQTSQALEFSPNGELLAAGSNDGRVRIYSKNGKLLSDLQAHRGSVLSLAFSADGGLLASGSWDRTARIWDLMDLGLAP